MMLDRRQTNNDGTGMWCALPYWKLAWIFLLFLGVGVIPGCGTPSSPTTAVGQHPQPSVAAHSFHDTVKTLDGDFTITLNITPNRSGTNVFRASVIDTQTNIPATHITITLYTTMQDMPMGTDSIILHAEGNGQFSTTSDTLIMGGHWAIGITIQTSDHIIYKAGISLKQLLAQVYLDAKQLVHLINTQLLQPSTLAILNDIATQAHVAYTGQSHTSTGASPGSAIWIYDNLQRLATFDVAPYTAPKP